jgi:hypothetical protein
MDNGGSAGIFGDVGLENESHSWMTDLLKPGDFTEDDGMPALDHSRAAIPSISRPADDSLHFAPFDDVSFAPCPSTGETISPYTGLASNKPSPGVVPLYLGYEQVRTLTQHCPSRVVVNGNWKESLV